MGHLLIIMMINVHYIVNAFPGFEFYSNKFFEKIRILKCPGTQQCSSLTPMTLLQAL